MPPDQIRAMNPSMANFSDFQIQQAASQFEMMANNPSMAKMAMDQMKNLTPEQIAAAQKGDFSSLPNGGMMGMGNAGSGGAPGGAGAGAAGPGGMDPSEMLKTMDKTQFKQMIELVRSNPEALKQLAGNSGISEEQLLQGVNAVANMDESKLDGMLWLVKNGQKAKDAWNTTNEKVGGHLKWIVLVMALVGMYGFLMVMIFIFSRWKSGGGGGDAAAAAAGPASMPSIPPVSSFEEEDEF